MNLFLRALYDTKMAMLFNYFYFILFLFYVLFSLLLHITDCCQCHICGLTNPVHLLYILYVLKSISSTAALRCALRAIVNDSERYVAMSRYVCIGKMETGLYVVSV